MNCPECHCRMIRRVGEIHSKCSGCDAVLIPACSRKALGGVFEALLDLPSEELYRALWARTIGAEAVDGVGDAAHGAGTLQQGGGDRGRSIRRRSGLGGRLSGGHGDKVKRKLHREASAK